MTTEPARPPHTTTAWHGAGQEPPMAEDSGIYAGVARIP